LSSRIELLRGDYRSLLPSLGFTRDATVVAFIAPPWGRALDEAKGLDLSKTIPPIKDIISFFDQTFPAQNLVLAMQVFEMLDAAPLAEVQALMDWSEVCVYDLNAPGKNHGLLLGTKRWRQ
jgi:hypothetical protein